MSIGHDIGRVLALVAIVLTAVPAHAENFLGQPITLAQWGSLPAVPPDQREQMRQQMREHWQQMPPEQREERRQAARERWQQMPQEERQRIREEMRERGGYGEGRHRR